MRHDLYAETLDGSDVVFTPFADKTVAIDYFNTHVKHAAQGQIWKRVQLFFGKDAIYPALAFDPTGNPVQTIKF